MTKKLFIQAILKICLGFVLIGLLIFLPAGTLSFDGGWLLMAILFVPMLIAGIIMMIKCPNLLLRRLNFKEKQKEQSIIIKLSTVMFVLGFIVAGLDFRFGWSRISKSITISAVIIFLASYLIYGEVIRENKYLSRTIEVEENQEVISSGLYSIVRHPMYFATVFLFLSMPIILGSLYSFLIFLAYPFIIAKRIKYEEKFLINGLCGYKEYTQKVKYRLIPFIW